MEEFKKWWEENGKKGISYCEIMCPLGLSKTTIRKYLAELNSRDFKPVHKKKQKCKIVQLTDLHIPFHDKESLKGVYSFLEKFKPDKIVLTGDIVDFYLLSKFDKDPNRRLEIQTEIDELYEVSQELKKHCQDIHYVAGNHENRLKRFLWQNPALASIKVLELPSLLNLDTLGITFHPFEYIYEGFRFTHGSIVRADSGATAKAEFIKYGGNLAHGHTHRLGSYLKSDSRGTNGAYEMGCLCKLDPEYVEGIPNWQQGFGIFHFNENHFNCQQIAIIKHKFIYGDKIYGV